MTVATSNRCRISEFGSFIFILRFDIPRACNLYEWTVNVYVLAYDDKLTLPLHPAKKYMLHKIPSVKSDYV